ncbi:MAG: exonuclease subunit SbcD [Propionibacteriales bacterium]|nr:exonuclease subunit SbcD [Propionibacteriales bacterium]
MRILHTSDWHLGRSFHREDLLGAQGAFIDHLVETVRAESVDAVVVAGDIYDRALPPVDAVQLASEALHRLAAERVRVVLSSGNHDSAHRLGFAADLIDAAGIHLRTDPESAGRPVLLEDVHGPVAIYAIPYLEPDLVREPWRLPERTHSASLGEAMHRVRRDLATRPVQTRSLVMSHAFVTGGQSSDSERDISVGGVSQVGVKLYDGVDYVALGHLHGRQQVLPHVRYSGSPLAYSFSEAGHHKGSWLVDLDGSGVDVVEFVPAPVPRGLAMLRGRLDVLLQDPRHAAVEEHWLHITLTDPVRPAEAMPRLRGRFPHALVLSFEPEGQGSDRTGSWATRVEGRSDGEIVREFVTDVRGEPPDAEEAALLQGACDACRLEDGAA